MTVLPIVPRNWGASPVAAQSVNPDCVVCIGGINMDVICRPHRPWVAGDSNPGKVRQGPGGVARNVAENLARLAVNTHLLAAVGDDALGRDLLLATARAGVQVGGVAAVAGARTACYVSLHGPEGELSLAVNDMEVLRHVDGPYIKSHQSLLAQAAVWVVDANLDGDALAALFSAPGQPTAGQPAIFADAVSSAKAARLQAHLPRIHTLKLNRQEASALLGHPVESTDRAVQAAQMLHQQGVARVVLSLGVDGVCWCDTDGSTGHLAANKVQVVNSNGAGDALLAGLVLGHLRGNSLPQAVRMGLACAEASLQSPLANALELGAV